MLIKTTSYRVDEKSKKRFLLDLNEIAILLHFHFVISHYNGRGGVYSNDHLNISYPMHRGALTLIDLNTLSTEGNRVTID